MASKVAVCFSRIVIHSMLTLHGFDGLAKSVIGHEFDTLLVDGAQVSVFKQTNNNKPHLLIEEPSQRSSGNVCRS